MKLLITVTLLSIVGFLFAQTDTPIKKMPVTVFKDGKAVGVKLVSPNADSSNFTDSDKTIKVKHLTVVKNYPNWHSNMTFFEKCKYWVMWFKYEHKFMFWTLLVLLSCGVLKMMLKLFSR